jgi:hypothetical protein
VKRIVKLGNFNLSGSWTLQTLTKLHSVLVKHVAMQVLGQGQRCGSVSLLTPYGASIFFKAPASSLQLLTDKLQFDMSETVVVYLVRDLVLLYPKYESNVPNM